MHGTREITDMSRFRKKSSGRFGYEEQSTAAVKAFSHFKDAKGTQVTGINTQGLKAEGMAHSRTDTCCLSLVLELT